MKCLDVDSDLCGKYAVGLPFGGFLLTSRPKGKKTQDHAS